MVRLLADVAILEGCLVDKKRRLMEGLCKLVRVDCWVWALMPPVSSGEKVTSVGVLHGGFDEARFAAYVQAVEHPEMAFFNGLFLEDVYKRGSQTTRTRQQLDPENRFESSAAYPFWQLADISPILLSCRPSRDNHLSFVALYRKASMDHFSERDTRIAHILLSEVPWLHELARPTNPKDSGQMLSPRQRMTLNLLLEGLGRKQIAAHLEITENTVSGYTKEIYRYYRVHSHAELMRYFREGDGGDR